MTDQTSASLPKASSGRLIIHGGLVLAAGDEQARPADLLIDNGTITEIGAPGQFDTLDATRRLDATDRLVMPAWVNGHTHAHGGRGRHGAGRLPRRIPFDQRPARAR